MDAESPAPDPAPFVHSKPLRHLTRRLRWKQKTLEVEAEDWKQRLEADTLPLIAGLEADTLPFTLRLTHIVSIIGWYRHRRASLGG